MSTHGVPSRRAERNARVSPWQGCVIGLASLLGLAFAGIGQRASAQAVWTQLGPEGGRVTAVAIHPVTPTTVYAGTVGGGIYRSTNAGSTWTAVNSGLLDGLDRLPVAVGALMIHPVLPSIIYAGTQGGAGLYRSTDGGQTWLAATSGLPATAVYALAIDPQNPSIVYVGSWGLGVFRSVDGGVSWSGTALTGRFVEALAIDPATPSIVYAGTNTGVFRTADSGANWAAANSGLPGTVPAVRALAINPATPTTLYAALSSGVFRSLDGAATWTATTLAGSIFELAIDPQMPTTILAGARTGMFRSVNAGANWTAINTGLQTFSALDPPYVSAVALNPMTPTTIYVGLRSGGPGVFKSTDSGASWAASNTGMRATGVPAVLIDPSTPSVLYVATRGDGVHRSHDDGATWTPLKAGSGADITALAVNAAATPTFFAGTDEGNVYRRTSGTDIWTRVSTGLPARQVTALATDPAAPAVVYAGTLDRGVYRSLNLGTTWAPLGLANQQIATLAVDPLTPSNLYAGTSHGFFRSTDSGANWTSATTGLSGGALTLVVDPVVPSTLYAGNGFGVFRSLDSGSTWTLSKTGLTLSPVHALAIDPSDTRILYVAGEGGVFCSTNFGVTWYRLSDLSGIEPESMAMPRGTPTRLHLGTFGSSTLGLDLGQDDGDGLPRPWEIDFALSPHSGTGTEGAAGDPDGDGRTNAEELALGTHPRGTFTRYLAEGATGAFFSTQLALANPATVARSVLLRFLRRNGQVVRHVETLRPLTRLTIDVATVDASLASEEFSLVLEADGPVALDRTMSWDRTGYGSHTETAVEAPSATWYLAEGSTAGLFDLFYLLQNPGNTVSEVRITFLRPLGAPVVRTFSVPATSRFTLWVDRIAELASTDVSAVIEVTSGPAIIVERAMYLSGMRAFEGGHESAGVTATATTWFLAEGATGPFFDEFVLLANPNAAAAQVRATYLLPSGATVVKHYVVPATSRRTVWVDFEDPQLADTAVSVQVESTNGVGIVVERAMWWPGPAADTWVEAHNSAGSTRTAARWVLGEGEVSGSPGGSTSVDTFILLANTSTAPGTVRVTLLFESGQTTAREYPVNASSRFNVWVRNDFPLAASRRFGAVVESLGATPLDLVVERALYRTSEGVTWSGGTNALAMPLQ